MTLQDFRAPKTFRGLLAGVASAVGRRLEGGKIPVSEVVSDEIRAVQFSLLYAEAELERSVFTVDMLRCRLRRLRATDGHGDYSPVAISAIVPESPLIADDRAGEKAGAAFSAVDGRAAESRRLARRDRG